MKKIPFVLFVVFVNINILFSQSFTSMGSLGITRLYASHVEWGDFDNDGDLDVAVMGRLDYGNQYSFRTRLIRIFKNNNGSFALFQNFSYTGVNGSLDWGDYDNDGDLDLAVSGSVRNNRDSYTYILRNDGNYFSNTGNTFLSAVNPGIDWGDYDNDGDLDLAVVGYPNSRIYRNDDGIFSAAATLPGSTSYYNSSSAQFGDYDKDGDLDLLILAGTRTRIYRNDGGSFTDIAAGLSDVYNGEVKWGDMDNDGDLDVVFAGSSSGIYLNDNGLFTLDTNLRSANYGSCDLGDYDNDGDLDILLTGGDSSIVYRNDDLTFVNALEPLTKNIEGSAAWGDYDNDGDLDIVLTGRTSNVLHTLVYRNDLSTVNVAPQPPAEIQSGFFGDSVLLQWPAASDDATPDSALTYNVLYSLNGQNYHAWQADTGTGYRRIADFGNVQLDTFAYFDVEQAINEYNPFCMDTLDDMMHVGVQTIDNGFKGSGFAWDSVRIFKILNPVKVLDHFPDTSLCFGNNLTLNHPGALVHSADFSTTEGPDARVTLNSAASFLAASPRSASLWIKTDSVASLQYLFSINDISHNAIALLGVSPNKKLVFDDGVQKFSNQVVADSLWHHVAYTFDGALIRIYIDGVLDATFSTTKYMSSTDRITLGNTSNGGTATAYKGKIAEFSLWNKVLSEQEINALRMNAPAPNVPMNNNLVVYFPFLKQCSGDSLTDFSGNELHGVYTNLRIDINDRLSGYNNAAYWSTNWDSQADGLISVADSAQYVPSASGAVYFKSDFGRLHILDTFSINIISRPQLSLPGDTLLCFNDSLVLNAGNFDLYQWSTGADSPDIVVRESGTYSVMVFDTAGCYATDSITVTINPLPMPQLGSDTAICAGDKLLLNPGSFVGFSWNTTDSSQTILADPGAMYSVTVTDQFGCRGSDTIAIGTLSPPVVELGADDTVCMGGQYLLSPNISGNGPFQYLWYDNSNPSLKILNTVDEGLGQHIYSVKVTDANGCSGNDTIMLTIDNCTGIDEDHSWDEVNVYPNPATEYVTVTNLREESLSVSVINGSGKILYRGKHEEKKFTILLQDYPQGIYYLDIRSRNARKTFRIIKI